MSVSKLSTVVHRQKKVLLRDAACALALSAALTAAVAALRDACL